MWCVVCVCCHQDGEAEVQRLVCEMRAEEERHKRELETVRQQCRREVEDAHKKGFNQCKTEQNIHYTEIESVHVLGNTGTLLCTQ